LIETRGIKMSYNSQLCTGNKVPTAQGTMSPQHSTAQHSTAQHSTAQHSTAQHSTAQLITPLL